MDPKTSVSESKLAANRANAKKSTGPKTDRGKMIASLNAATHGVYAKSIIPDGPPWIEDKKAYIALLEGLRAHWEPVGIYEDWLVQEIANAKWKALRLERFEAAGVSERLSKVIDARRSRVVGERYAHISNGRRLHSIDDPGERPSVTAADLLEQMDLVDRINRDDADLREEPSFIAFVAEQKELCSESEDTIDRTSVESRVRQIAADLPPAELATLTERFCSQMDMLLDSMWLLRAKTVPFESSVERTLVPDESEMNQIIRAAAHLMRLEEKRVSMLEHVQEARRRKEGRTN